MPRTPLVLQQPFPTEDVPCRYNGLMFNPGADHAFARVPKKLEEHYGITIAASTIQALTEKHANQIYEQEKSAQIIPDKAGCKVQIGEMDGSMIPIVSIDEETKDKRKNKTLSWKEARLSIAHEEGSTTLKFGAVFQGSVDDAGQCLLNSAILAGFGKQTYFHAKVLLRKTFA